MIIPSLSLQRLITLLTLGTLFGPFAAQAQAARSCDAIFKIFRGSAFSDLRAPLTPNPMMTMLYSKTERAPTETLPLAGLKYEPKTNVKTNVTFSPPKMLPIFGTLRADFKHDTKYTVEIDDQSPIKDQCSLGVCHLFSWGSELEQEYKDRTGKDLVVSMNYVAARYWAERVMEELVKPTFEDAEKTKVAKIEVALGNWPVTSRKYILKSGLIPDGAWKPKVDFTSPPYSTRLEEYVENIIANVRYIRDMQRTQEAKDDITREGAMRLKAVFENMVGVFPTSFSFEGQFYTPHTFLEERFPQLTEPLVGLLVHPNPKGKTVVEVEKDQTTIVTRLPEIEAAVRAVLDKGHNVYLGYQHEAAFVDKETGLMSPSAFVTPMFGGALPMYARNYFGKIDNGHAVQIVGYDLDPVTGRVLKWKIKNSWGSKAASAGYFHMYADYFKTFAIGVYFERNLGIKLPEAETVEEKQLDLPFPEPRPDARVNSLRLPRLGEREAR